MKRFLLFLLSALLILGFGISAQAVPSAGVVADGGPYWGPSQDWVPAWTDDILGTGQGFILPGGTGDLTLWYGANNANSYDKITPADMYLFSTYNFVSDPGFTEATSTLGWTPTNQIDGYKGADGVFDGGYYVWELPDIDGFGSGVNSPWEIYDDFSPLPGDPTVADSTYGGNKQFNFLTGTFGDGVVLPAGEWLFLVALLDDELALAELTNGAIGPNGGGTQFIFSPKTTSTTVPEPATMLLLGSGLLGLAGFRKKIFKK
jgi:hypothetical protein